MTDAEPLPHNANNAVTFAIERTSYGGRPAVRKVLSGANLETTRPEWRAAKDPEHWNFWKREALVYQSELGDCLRGSGVRLPALYAVIERSPTQLEVIMEDVAGRSGARLTLDDYVHAARCWGRAQGLLTARGFSTTWLSTGFLREYTASKPVDYGLLDDDGAWSRPLIADNWPRRLRAQLRALHQERAALYAIAASAPRAPSHLDLWPNNIVVDTTGQLVPIDWAFFGDGALGEDIANFIPDAVFDDFMGPERLSRMETELSAAYLDGLDAAGLSITARELRRAMTACAVKYVWLGPLLLAKAADPNQQRYGGAALTDANRQYRNRGATLSFLCDWAEQAIAP